MKALGAENNFLSFQEMIIIGLTGGIGSGKTKVLSFFKNKGILCYNSDKRAKILFNSNLKIKSKIKNYFGDEIISLISLIQNFSLLLFLMILKNLNC